MKLTISTFNDFLQLQFVFCRKQHIAEKIEEQKKKTVSEKLIYSGMALKCGTFKDLF